MEKAKRQTEFFTDVDSLLCMTLTGKREVVLLDGKLCPVTPIPALRWLGGLRGGVSDAESAVG